MSYLLVLIPVLAILSDIYLETPEGSAWGKYGPFVSYSIALIAIFGLGYLWVGEEYFQHILAIPVMMLVIVVFYMLDIIRGGADAKALIALTILFPLHPQIGDFPILQSDSGSAEILFPFSFVILINAAIVVAVLPIGFLIKNLASRELGFPGAFLGYKMNIDEIPGKHVWLMERMDNGIHRSYVRPRSDEDLPAEIARLSRAGYKRVWITPKIPFIIPMTISLVISTILGNLLLLVVPL